MDFFLSLFYQCSSAIKIAFLGKAPSNWQLFPTLLLWFVTYRVPLTQVWNRGVRVIKAGNRLLRLPAEFFHIAHGHARRGDRLPRKQIKRTRLDVPGIHLEH